MQREHPVETIGRHHTQSLNKPLYKRLVTWLLKGLKIASKIASIINSEKKFYDDYYVPTAVVVGTPLVRQITAIPQGTGDGQRNGLSIAIDSIQGNNELHGAGWKER